MTHYKNNGGLSSDGRPHSDFVDERGGARDNVAPHPKHPLKEHSTAHERAQSGADVRPETEPEDFSMPEGLRRERKGPYSPHRGRSKESATPKLGTHAENGAAVEGKGKGD